MRSSLRLFSQAAASSSYEDKALTWARSHPLIAQKCLDIPALADATSSDNHSSKLSHGGRQYLQSFSDYWTLREWKFPESLSAKERVFAEALASHVLSAPLTLAQNLVSVAASSSTRQKWCCIGARAEASLPIEYWKEVLVVLGWYNVAGVEIQLDFMGPDLGSFRRPSVSFTHKSSKLDLHWTFSGKFHEMDFTEATSYDAYILLNPGLGHKHLLDGWKPALERLLECSGTKLLTAHSELDAHRDAQILLEYYESDQVKYDVNAFASRITYQDPFDLKHFVQPNHYAAVIRP